MKMTTTTNAVGTVKIRSTCASILKKNYDRIAVLFAADLKEKFKSNEQQSSIIYYDVLFSNPDGIARSISDDFIPRLQKYVDDICLEGCNLAKSVSLTAGGEDSSYDSDGDNYYDHGGGGGGSGGGLQQGYSHQDVSRTTSDTLAAEYAEYVQGAQQQQQQQEISPGYNARVEFALKLGYTEKHVQAALQKLGLTPTQNELLAELIKLGAQKGCGSSCDSSPTDSLVNDMGFGHLERYDILDGNHPVTLRPIVVDGSNVAMSHGNKEVFSCRGIKICVDWFKSRGHNMITVFVPKWRKEAPRPDNPIRDQEILAELERERLLVFTPSRLVGGKRMVCYDDRYILKLAAQNEGIVVSNDNYRDLCQENVEFRKVVEERILMYSFVNDHFMPPDDPLGRGGPTLDNFLKISLRKGDLVGVPPPPPCPYGKKCTYGNKCKYHHPERGPLPHKSVTERLSEHAQRHLQARENKETGSGDIRKNPLGRTRSNIPPPKEPQQHAIVSKSRSVDNVGGLTQQQQQSATILNPDFSTYQTSVPPENLHRKLQRQLTLNPSSDSRIQSRRGFVQQQLPPLSPNCSSNYLNTSRWATAADLHQCVTRIASAPDSYRGGTQQHQTSGGWPGAIPNAAAAAAASGVSSTVHHMHRMSSCSDSQLNIWSGHQQQQQQWNPTVTMGSPQQEDARRKLHYHLAAIFPEEQVLHAMRMYPEETNAQKICAAILAMNAPKV